jgi:zinc-ribbon domain
MVCVRCGQELPDTAQFCLKCGSGVSVVAPIPASGAVTIRPYNWGIIQGWLLVIGSPLLALGRLSDLARDSGTEEDPGRALGRTAGMLIVCALFFVMGIGILKKKRYGLILVYVTLGLICLSIVVGFAESGAAGALSAATGAGIWVASTIYYHKRRDEFATGVQPQTKAQSGERGSYSGKALWFLPVLVVLPVFAPVWVVLLAIIGFVFVVVWLQKQQEQSKQTRSLDSHG